MAEREDRPTATGETRAGGAFDSTVNADVALGIGQTPSGAFASVGPTRSRPLPLVAAWLLWLGSLALSVTVFAVFFWRLEADSSAVPSATVAAGGSELLEALLDLARWDHFLDLRRLFIFASCLSLAGWVVSRRPREAMALLFAAFLTCIAVMPITGYLSYLAVERLQASPFRGVVLANYTVMAFTGLAFLALFPGGRLVPGLRGLVIPLWAFGSSVVLLRWWLLPDAGRLVFSALVVIGLLLCATVWWRYRHHATRLEQLQLKWVLLAAISLLLLQVTAMFVLRPLIGVHQAPVSVLAFLSLEVVLALSVAVPVLLFAFGVVRHRLWDIDVVINRSLVYGGLLLALTLVFAFTFVIFGLGFHALAGTAGQLWALLIGAVCAALLFKPALQRLKRLVDERVYGIRVDYDALARARRSATTGGAPTGDAPREFGPYTDLTPIGRGGMGQIFRARRRDTGDPVALKVLRDHLCESEESARRFLREAEIAGRLDHPNIVVIRDRGVVEGAPYLAMDLVRGADLASLLRERRALPLAEALPILRGVAAALDYAHGHGVVHRDVKPSNILLDGPERRPVLTDFGIASLDAARTRLTREGTVLGTLDYISPEQIHGEARLTGRADIYALGVTAFEMLTGSRPFVEDRAVRLAMAHLMRPPPDPRELAPDVPRGAAQAIGRALQKHPEDRFATAGEFVAALAEP